MTKIVWAGVVAALAGCASTRSASIRDATTSGLDAEVAGEAPPRAVGLQAAPGLGFRPVESSGIAVGVYGPGEWRLTERGWTWFRAGASTEPLDRFGRVLPTGR